MRARRRAKGEGRKVKALLAHRFLLSILVLLLFSLCASCGSGNNSQDKQADQAKISVAAAANLTDAFAELGNRFTEKTGVRVTFNFGATADLERQIENGAPFDAFASADVEHVEQLKEKGLLTPGTDHVYAQGRLVLWIPPGSALKLSRVEDVTSKEVERVSIAKPDVAPYGRATVEALRALNIWQEVEPKVIYAQNVAQAKQYTATGNAEVAFIPRALVKADEGQAIEIDERLHQPIDQSIAVVKDSSQQEAAQRFVTFVLSAEGQALLEKYGYKRAVTGDK